MRTQAKQPENETINNDCVLYYRVSRNVQSDIRQENDCIEYCQRNSYVIKETFREKISGKIRNREKLTSCIDYVKENNIRFLIVSELSRLGRSNEVNDIIEELAKHKICVITLKEGIKTMKFNERNEWVKDDDQIFLAGIITAINKKESDTIGYRISSGKRNATINNKSWGGKFITYGYKIEDKQLIIDEKEAKIIKYIFEKYNAGWGAVKISNHLNLNHVPTKTKTTIWHKSTINQVLDNPIYKGIRQFNKEDIGYYEQLRIVDDITFNTAQQRKTNWKNRNTEFTVKRKYEYLFDNRIIQCAVCGKHYYGLIRNDRKQERLYKCTSGKYSKGCGNKSISIELLEQRVKETLPINIGIPNFEEQLKTLQTDLQLYKAEQQKYIASKERYNDVYAMGNMTKAKYIEKVEQSNDMINKLQKQIISIEEQINLNRTLKDNKEAMLQARDLDKDTLHKHIKRIVINAPVDKKQKIDIVMITGNIFSFMV